MMKKMAAVSGSGTGCGIHHILWLFLIVLLLSWPIFGEPNASVNRDTDTLVFLADKDYPPITWLQDGQPKGLSVEIMAAIAQQMGQKIRIELMDWQLAQQKFLDGYADGLLDMSITEERKKLYDFAETGFVYEYGLFVRSSDQRISDVSDLTGMKVGVTAGGLPRKYFEKRGDVKLVIIENYADGFEQLKNWAIDTVAADIWVGGYTLEQNNIKGITAAGEPFAKIPAGIAVKKGNTPLAARLNQAIGELQKNQKLSRVFDRWHSKQMVFYSRQQIQAAVTLIAASILLALMVVMIIWIATLKKQIRIRKAAENALRQGEKRYQIVADNTYDWEFWIGPDGQYVYISPSCVRITGYTPQEFKEDPGLLSTIIHPEDKSAYQAHLAECRSQYSRDTIEFRILHKNQQVRWIEHVCQPIFDNDGKWLGSRGSNSDITDRRQAEKKTRDSERKSHAWIEHSPVCTKIVDLDFNLQFMSESGIRELKIDDINEFYGKPYPFDFYPDSFKIPMRNNLRKAKETGEVITQEASVNDIEGNKLWYHSTIVPVNDDQGKLDYLLVVSLETTARKQAEEALLLEQEITKRIMETSPIGIVASNSHGEITFANARAEKILGLNRTEVAKRTYNAPDWHITDYQGEPLPEDRLPFRLVKDSGKAVYDIQHAIQWPDGKRILLSIHAAPLCADSGKFEGIIAAIEDVTERCQMEQALRDALLFNQEVISGTAEGITVYDRQLCYLEWNRCMENLTGIKKESVLGRYAPDLFSHLRQWGVDKLMERALAGETVHSPDIWFELPQTGKKGWVTSIYSPHRDARGNIIGVIGVIQDITRRKETEESLIRAAREWTETFDAMSDGVSIQNHDFVILNANKSLAGLLGRDKEDIVGRKCYTLLHCQNNPIDDCPLDRCKITQKEECAEVFEPSLGKWLAVSTSPVMDEQGNIQKIIHTVRDITERKRAEREREMTVEFLALVNQSTNMDEMIRAATAFFREKSGCQAVGIRLKKGENYPYYEARGFSGEFILKENNLCTVDENGSIQRDSDGFPIYECMCGNIICGRFDPSKPFFTSRGSFWTNSTTELLATSSEADRQARTRNRCNGEGYESVALLPLHFGLEQFGLVQLNDKRKGLFTPELIALWERLADHMAGAIAKFLAEEALKESEAQFHCLFDAMSEGVALHELVTDKDGKAVDYRIIDVNPAYVAHTGLKVAQAQNQLASNFYGSQSPPYLDLYAHVVQTGKPLYFQTCFAPLKKYFEISVFSPKPGWFATVFMDITQHRETEQKLWASEEKFMKAFQGSPLVMAITTIQDGRFIEVNDYFLTTMKFQRSEVIGKTSAELGLYVDPGQRKVVIDMVRDTGSARNIEIMFHGRDGQMHCGLFSAEMIDLQGTRYLLTSMNDITERKRAEELLLLHQANMAHLLRLSEVGEMASGLAHELNQPLCAIENYTQACLRLMETKPDSLRLGEVIKDIRAQAERAGKIVHRVKGLVRKKTPHFELARIKDIILEAVELFGLEVKKQKINIRLNIPDNLMPVYADYILIEQVVLNLIRNGLEAMNNPQISKKELTIHAQSGPNSLIEVCISDTGCGIPEENMNKIFESFFTTKPDGLGIGLPLSRAIIESHSGKIWVTANPDGGTIFHFTLPTRSPADEI
jgi:PAS domain S-box-containing protein